MEPKTPQLVFSPSNPYIAKNIEILEDDAGRRLPVRPAMTLCRCGKSKNQPFCDGRHSEAGFFNAGKEDKPPGAKKEYRGREITITFDLSVCAHAAVCLTQLPSVFQLGRRPWINPDGAQTRQIIETIEACPSGALQYVLKGKSQVHRPRETKIVLAPNGPYNVTGGIELCGDTQPPADPERYCLCRCGRTQNTPFCDGSHRHRQD
jgi:CDGSH-type Zn-finger protein/ferredoxin